MIIDFEDGFAPEDGGPKRKLKGPLALSTLIVIGALFLQNTLAANISLGSSSIEFGQGVQVATACSGNNTLTMTPNSGFSNSSGAGAYYLKSVTISGVPTSCYGVDFNISAYDSTTSTALPIFNSTTKIATVYYNNGTFELGVGSTGMSITSGSGTFTITFATPVATAGMVSRMTLLSGAHVPIPCADGGTCVLGEVGPGGGNIFYVSVGGFDCGPSYTSTGSPTGGQCHYLEAAPKTWDGGTTDGRRVWANVAPSTTVDISGIPNDNTASLTNFGLGYKNSIALVAYNASTLTSGAAARAYTGGSKTDWYLPASGELHQLIKWSKGLGASDSSVCANTGTLNTSPAQGFVEDQYFSSSENGLYAWSEHPRACGIDAREKDNAHSYLMRPIRAF